MRAVRLDPSLRLEAKYSKPNAPPGEALVRVHQAGVCATDIQLVKGYRDFRGTLGHEFVGTVEPRNGSWITKVRASYWRTWQNKKMSHHHEGDYDFFYFTMHTNSLHGFFAPNCRF